MSSKRDIDISDVTEDVGSDFSYTFIFERLPKIADFHLIEIPNSNLLNSPIVQFYTFAVILEYGILKTVGHVFGETHSLLSSPITIVIPIGTIIGALGLRYILDKYALVIKHLSQRGIIEDRSSYEMGAIITFPIQLLLYSVVLTPYLWFVVFRVDVLTLFVQGGSSQGAAFLMLNSLVYIPLIVDFILVYVTIQLIVPNRLLSTEKVKLLFYDPQNLAGLGELGRLLKNSFYLYILCLCLYLLLSYGPYVFPQLPADRTNPPGAVQAMVFSLAWAVGTGLLLFSLIRIKRTVKRTKQTQLRRIERKVRELQEDPYKLDQLTVSDEERFEALQHNITQIRNTREFPLTMRMWFQIGLSVILPELLQLVLYSLL